MIHENGMKQIMNEYTRTTENTNTLIDLVITNRNNIRCKINNNEKISDHATIKIEFEHSMKEKEFCEKKTILYKYNTQELEDKLKKKKYYYCSDKNLSCSYKA